MLFAREYRKVALRHEIGSKLARRETWVTGSGLVIAFLGVMEVAPSGLSPELLATAATLSGVGGFTTVLREKQRKDERVEDKKRLETMKALDIPDAPGFEPDPGPWGEPVNPSQAPDGQQVIRRR